MGDYDFDWFDRLNVGKLNCTNAKIAARQNGEPQKGNEPRIIQDWKG